MDGNDGARRIPASIFKSEYGVDPILRGKGCRLRDSSLAQLRSLVHKNMVA